MCSMKHTVGDVNSDDHSSQRSTNVTHTRESHQRAFPLDMYRPQNPYRVHIFTKGSQTSNSNRTNFLKEKQLQRSPRFLSDCYYSSLVDDGITRQEEEENSSAGHSICPPKSYLFALSLQQVVVDVTLVKLSPGAGIVVRGQKTGWLPGSTRPAASVRIRKTMDTVLRAWRRPLLLLKSPQHLYSLPPSFRAVDS